LFTYYTRPSNSAHQHNTSIHNHKLHGLYLIRFFSVVFVAPLNHYRVRVLNRPRHSCIAAVSLSRFYITSQQYTNELIRVNRKTTKFELRSYREFKSTDQKIKTSSRIYIVYDFIVLLLFFLRINPVGLLELTFGLHKFYIFLWTYRSFDRINW